MNFSMVYFVNDIIMLNACALLGRHGSASLCRDGQEKKMAATYNLLAFKR